MNETQFTASNDDDIFNSWVASEEERKQKEEERKKNSGNYQKREYEAIKYVGLSKEHPTIVRFVGNFVAEDLKAHRPNPTDMKFMHISKVKSDDGKNTFYLYLPLRSDEPEQDHLMWKIIDKVYAKEWVKDPATNKNKSIETFKIKHPDIYEKVNKGGFTEADGKWPYMYAKGWKGSEMLLINVIDRRDDWCKVNKHTKLISKNVNVTAEGKEYADFGVPAFGFFGPLTNLRNNFKMGWEKYDVVITKTGEKLDTVTNMFNGTAFTNPAAIAANLDKSMGISADEYKYISQEPALTEEELNYARYDLDENFRVTSYRTIDKYLGKTIQLIDAAVNEDLLSAGKPANSHFYADLQALVKEEAEAWAKEKAAKDAAQGIASEAAPETPTEAPSAPSFETMASVQEAAPIARTVSQEAPASGLTPEKLAVLKGYNELSTEQKSYIKDVVLNSDGTLNHIEWTDTAPSLLDCPKDMGGCGQLSPNSFSVCPACAKHFM
ncbi:MAG: hypothetical protein II304_06535 [Bacteroidales bacterium]|nr:hypothetical protein [Bacteroidales bacterium]